MWPDVQPVLLGGASEQERNLEIGRGFAHVIHSPHERGLRDGIVSVAACDVVLSGDTLAMHLGVALEKRVVVWFGPTCAQEIDLYGRGQKILTAAGCSPCWKADCQQPRMCYDQVPLATLLTALRQETSIAASTHASIMACPI
jgi:heptosyltransferase-2